VAVDKDPEERIEPPASGQAERQTRLTPAQAVAEMRINVPVRGNRKLRTLIERVNADRQLKAWWHVANVNAIVRLEINDHSWVHIQIVTNIALKLLRQLTKHGVEPSLVRDYGMGREDAEITVALGALMHDIGMSVHREGHEDFSLFLAEPKLRELLAGLYEEPELTVIVAEVLGAVTSHRDYGKPLTLEAGIVRVADALDMAQGRSRIPFERGRVTIHSRFSARLVGSKSRLSPAPTSARRHIGWRSSATGSSPPRQRSSRRRSARHFSTTGLRATARPNLATRYSLDFCGSSRCSISR